MSEFDNLQEPCDNCNNDVCCCTIKKQETLEEDAERMFTLNSDDFGNYIRNIQKQTWIAGAKSDSAKEYWFKRFQQEQDNNFYSEEDLKKAFQIGRLGGTIKQFNQLLKK
jgi:hypothetical protein